MPRTVTALPAAFLPFVYAFASIDDRLIGKKLCFLQRFPNIRADRTTIEPGVSPRGFDFQSRRMKNKKGKKREMASRRKSNRGSPYFRTRACSALNRPTRVVRIRLNPRKAERSRSFDSIISDTDQHRRLPKSFQQQNRRYRVPGYVPVFAAHGSGYGRR